MRVQYIITNSKKNSEVKSPTTRKYVELDLWIPDKELGFEFQDTYHYTTTWYSQTPLSGIQQADDEKKIEIRKKGISLIEIPYWWKGDSESLLATALFHRPDLIEDSSNSINESFFPISLNPTSEISHDGKIPDIGELMYASFFYDVNFKKVVSAENTWWMGEKYDGLRICWHPVRKQLYTRSGGELALKDSVRGLLPRMFIDGEAWFGRGGYVKSQTLLSSPDLVHWKYFRVIAFDVPTKSQSYPFELRYEYLLTIPPTHPFVALAFRGLCNNSKQLMNTAKYIIENDGEGVILRKPQSVYEQGRTNNLIKVKAARGDSEAIVMEAKQDQVILKSPDETIFNVPAANVLVQMPLKKGDVVSFSYTAYSRYSVPKNAQIIRLRLDLTWKEVLLQHAIDYPVKEKVKYSFQQYGYWAQQKDDNFRGFFEEYARSKGIDALNADSWYDITLQSIKEFKGGYSVLSYMRGGIVKALLTAFPDIGLDKYKFKVNYNLLQDVRNRRKWFLNFAQAKEIHPFVAENWYQIETDNILETKGGAIVLRHYSHNFATAVIHLFPEVKFDPSKFISLPPGFWKDVNNRRRFFVDYAQKMAFSPLVASNWYKVTHTQLLAEKRSSQVLAYYQGNFVRALRDVFPNIGIDGTRFALPKSYWMDEENRRWFFTSIAKKLAFDYKVPENWYSITSNTISSFQGASTVLQFHNGNWIKALASLFPHIELDILKFHHYPTSYWQNAENKRWIFEEYARQNSFDALVAENWYPHLRDVYSVKALQGILNQYDGSIGNTLTDIFPQVKFVNMPKIPSGYYDDIRNRQSFFKAFADEKGFDPLVPDNWYSTPLQTIRSFKGSQIGIKPYSGNVVKALLHLFPKIGLEETKFGNPVDYWQNPTNRKQLFERVAEQRGFDPHVLDNWSTITKLSLANIEYARGLSEYYGEQSIAADIRSLFQSSANQRELDIILHPRKYWANVENQKSFLLSYAKMRGFDPLDPDGWYYVTTTDVIKHHKGKSLVEHYNGSLISALSTAFPDIGLDISKFSTVPRNYWQKEENRKRFFELYALENGFDPLQAEQWYKISKSSILKQKGGHGVLQHFKKNMVEALSSSFPNIGLDPAKFTNPTNYS